MAETLSPEDVAAQVEGSEWRVQDGRLVRDFKHADFGAAIAFVNRVAEVAERLNHHPDIAVHDYNAVTLTTISHDVGGLTERDIKLARAVDALP